MLLTTRKLVHACGWGCVVRNSRDVLEVEFGRLQRLSSPLHAEAVGALRGVERAVHLGMTHVVLETDASALGEALKSSDGLGVRMELCSGKREICCILSLLWL